MIASPSAVVAALRGRALLACILAMSLLLATAADGRAAVEVQLNEGVRQVNAQSIGCVGGPGCVNSGSKHEASGATGSFAKSAASSSECPSGGLVGSGKAGATQSSVLDVGPGGVLLRGTGSATANAKRCPTSDGASNAGFSFTVTGSPVNYTLGGLLATSAPTSGVFNVWATASAVMAIRKTADFFIVAGAEAFSGVYPGDPTPSAPVDLHGTLQPGSYSLGVSANCHAKRVTWTRLRSTVPAGRRTSSSAIHPLRRTTLMLRVIRLGLSVGCRLRIAPPPRPSPHNSRSAGQRGADPQRPPGDAAYG